MIRERPRLRIGIVKRSQCLSESFKTGCLLAILLEAGDLPSIDAGVIESRASTTSSENVVLLAGSHLNYPLGCFVKFREVCICSPPSARSDAGAALYWRITPMQCPEQRYTL